MVCGPCARGHLGPGRVAQARRCRGTRVAGL